MTCAWHVMCVGDKRGAYRVLERKPEEPLKTPMCKQECNRTVDLQEIRWRRETDWSASGQRQVTGFCKTCNEPSNSIKCGKFLD
jgi:hypothetical protein